MHVSHVFSFNVLCLSIYKTYRLGYSKSKHEVLFSSLFLSNESLKLFFNLLEVLSLIGDFVGQVGAGVLFTFLSVLSPCFSGVVNFRFLNHNSCLFGDSQFLISFRVVSESDSHCPLGHRIIQANIGDVDSMRHFFGDCSFIFIPWIWEWRYWSSSWWDWLPRRSQSWIFCKPFGLYPQCLYRCQSWLGQCPPWQFSSCWRAPGASYRVSPCKKSRIWALRLSSFIQLLSNFGKLLNYKNNIN